MSNSVPTPIVDAEARENGGVTPTHGRTREGQKAWFLQRAAAHRAAVLKAQASSKPTTSAEDALAAAKADFAQRGEGSASDAQRTDSPTLAPTGNAAEPVPSPPPPPPSAAVVPPSAPKAAVDVSDGAPADGLSERLRELTLAGGDLPTLGALATRDRTELTAVLKSLGFKGLKTRNELEQELKTWHGGAVAH